MCGIAGIIETASGPGADAARQDAARQDAARLVRMRDALRHRGPDGEGLHIDGRAGLTHRRLAIVDLDRGHQPMANEDGSIWIVFNGEIYNHAELRPGLKGRGHVYRTQSDTETILHLYEEEGDRCVERLRGMFAFAIWDGNRQRLLLARDRVGIKPLYFACTNEEILFASEIKAILAAGPIRPELNRGVLNEYLATRFVAGEETFFRGIRKLLPGRILTWSRDEGMRIQRWWRPPREVAPSVVSPGRAAGEIRERLEQAVRSHLMSDVPLGLFLSGGIDSSAIAGLMAPMLSEPIRTFSVGFDDPGTSELAWARLVSRAVRSEHREVVVSSRQFWQELPRLIWHEDEPIAFSSSIPLYFLSRLAREHVKVVLTGEGADELFLGYNRYRVTFWNDRLARARDAVLPPFARGALRRASRWLPGRLGRYAARTFLARSSEPRDLYFENFSVFPQALRSRLLPHGRGERLQDPFREELRSYFESDAGTLEQMGCADLQTYLVELLMKQDQMSMAASIESRVPFLDVDLVDYAAALPGRLKLRGMRTKAVLREALRDLVPREILTRRKMGFPVPLGSWLRGPHRDVVADYILSERALGRDLFDRRAIEDLAAEHLDGTADHGERLWLLVNLEIWQRIFLDGEGPLDLQEASHARE